MKLWTGIACLVADPNCKEFRRFGDNVKGAYVNTVAWACSEEEFGESPEELIDMRNTAQRQPTDIIFGTFHTWDQSDEN